MQAQVYEGYFENGMFYNKERQIIKIPEMYRVNVTLFDEPFSIQESEFAEYILADLVAQGCEGQELLENFKKNSRAIRPAVRKLIEDVDTFARSGEGKIPLDELFEKVE